MYLNEISSFYSQFISTHIYWWEKKDPSLQARSCEQHYWHLDVDLYRFWLTSASWDLGNCSFAQLRLMILGTRWSIFIAECRPKESRILTRRQWHEWDYRRGTIFFSRRGRLDPSLNAVTVISSSVRVAIWRINMNENILTLRFAM